MSTHWFLCKLLHQQWEGGDPSLFWVIACSSVPPFSPQFSSCLRQSLIESSAEALENMPLSNRALPRMETLPVRIKRHQSTLNCASLLTHGFSIFFLWVTIPSWNFPFLIILILVRIVACWDIRKICGTYNPGYRCLSGSISRHIA